jgi:hypothetical protein
LDEGLEQALEKYYELKQKNNFTLDTVKISIARQILTDLHNYENAEKLHLFKKMYTTGQLDKTLIVDNRYRKVLSTGWFNFTKDDGNNITLAH